jgi:hypothetical protein
MGGLCSGEGEQNNTSRNRKPSIYPQYGVWVKKKEKSFKEKAKKITPCAPIPLIHPLSLLTLHSTHCKWGFVGGAWSEKGGKFLLMIRVCVCPIHPTANAQWDELQIACLGNVYWSQTSCCRGGRVYSAAAIPRGGLFLRKRVSALPTPNTMLRNGPCF